jgi:hypothetical protein
MDKAIVGLAEAISALRLELTVAMQEGKAHNMQFAMEPIELTVQTVITKDADGKIGWKVLGVGASYETATTQTLKLILAPVWRNTDGTLVRDFTIADVAASGAERDSVGPRSQ